MPRWAETRRSSTQRASWSWRPIGTNRRCGNSGQRFSGGSGQGVRAGFLVKTIAGMVAATEVANYALSGHSTLQNQPGHTFEIEMHAPNGGFVHVGILP